MAETENVNVENEDAEDSQFEEMRRMFSWLGLRMLRLMGFIETNIAHHDAHTAATDKMTTACDRLRESNESFCAAINKHSDALEAADTQRYEQFSNDDTKH